MLSHTETHSSVGVYIKKYSHKHNATSIIPSSKLTIMCLVRLKTISQLETDECIELYCLIS